VVGDFGKAKVGRVDDALVKFSRCVQVNIVHPGTVPADYLDAGKGLEDLPGDLDPLH
jgi:hypothetical protein